MISTEKPGSPAELVHFGVKGMQWGVHKTQGTRDFYAKNPTSKQRSVAIDKARASTEKTRQAYAKQDYRTEKRATLKKKHEDNPNHATALRLKRGEKIAAGILMTQGYMPITSLAATGVVVGRVGKRRALEA